MISFDPCTNLKILQSLSSYASPVAQMVKNPPAMQEIWVRALGWEDPLEEGMATHSNILASRIPRTEESGSYNPWGHESDTTEQLNTSTHPYFTAKGTEYWRT